MAEKRIDELPLIVDPNGSTAFPVEQDGVAKRMSLQGMRDYVFEHGADTVVVTFANFQASMTSSEIFAQANLGRNIVLRMQDENVHYDAPLAMASKNYCLFAKNSANATNTYQIDSNGTVTITNNIYIRSNASDTIGGNYRLNLNYTPDGDKNAVNKKYVDSIVGSATGRVGSVNGKTGKVTLTASDVGALSDDTPIPSKTSELSNDSGFITSADVPTPPVQSVNGKTGEVTVREVPGYASAAASAVLTKLSDGSIGWAILQELPEPSLEAVEQWVASLDPGAFDAVSQIYNFFLDQDYWNETTDGDIRYFYSAVANAIRTGDVLTELKRSAAAGETGKIAMLLDGKWKVIIPPYVTSQTAPVRSVNGKTGDVTIDVPSVPQSDIAANTAARHTHYNKETLDAIPNKSGAETGQILMKSEDGIEWADIDPVPSAESATIGSVLTKTGNGNVYNWRIVQGLTVRLNCDTALIDSDPDLAEVESNISGLRTANDIGLSIMNGTVGTAELYDIGNSNEWIAYRLYKVTYDYASKNYGLVFEHAEEGQVKYAELYGTSRIPSFYTRQYSRVPAVTTEDEGKILKVVNGEPVWVSP